MDVDEDLMAFLTAKLDPVDTPVASDILTSLRRPNPMTTPYVDKNTHQYDDDIAAFLELKEASYTPTVPKPSTEPAQKSVDSLIRLMRGLTTGVINPGARPISNPANTHDEQKMQLTADLRGGKSSITFPVLPVGLRLNAIY